MPAPQLLAGLIAALTGLDRLDLGVAVGQGGRLHGLFVEVEQRGVHLPEDVPVDRHRALVREREDAEGFVQPGADRLHLVA